MKIREQFKKDFKNFINVWSKITLITLFILSICYSYEHFLIDILRLPLLAPEKDGRGEFLYFFSTVIYSVLFWVLYTILEAIVISYKKIKNYVFE